MLTLEGPASEPCGRETKGVGDCCYTRQYTNIRRLMQAISDPLPTVTIIAQAGAFSEGQCARTCAREPSLDSHIVFDVNVSETAEGSTSSRLRRFIEQPTRNGG
jgi:hypothetical protein